MAATNRPRAPRKTKPCLCCQKIIVQGLNEGMPYFTKKKFCSQKCNAQYRLRKKAAPKLTPLDFVRTSLVR